MKMSFEGNESFKEATASLRFNDPPSENSLSGPNTLRRMGSSMPPQERGEDT